MTPEQEQHLHTIKETFDIWVDRKYRAGQKEHGGNLFDLSFESLLDNAIDECVDQFVYLLTIRQSLVEKRIDKQMKQSTYPESID